MFIITLRDLQWRRRRFAIAVLGTALVFAMALTIAGLSHGFDVEAQTAVRQLGADGWAVGTGAGGPFLGQAAIPVADAAAITRIPGVRAASPVVYGRKGVGAGANAKDVNVIGAVFGQAGMPAATSGRMPHVSGEIAVSTRLKGSYPIGSALEIAGHPFRVVGRIRNATMLAGIPTVFVTLADAQQLMFGSTAITSSFAITGTPTGLAPPGLMFMTNKGGVTDIERPLQQAHSAITYLALLLFAVAALIVGSMVYLSALERQRDFAVLKATGVTTGAILAGLAMEAVLVSVGAAILALLLSVVIIPFFPLRVVVSDTLRALLPAVGVVVGLLASALVVRRATSVDPALAFGGP